MPEALQRTENRRLKDPAALIQGHASARQTISEPDWRGNSARRHSRQPLSRVAMPLHRKGKALDASTTEGANAPVRLIAALCRADAARSALFPVRYGLHGRRAGHWRTGLLAG